MTRFESLIAARLGEQQLELLRAQATIEEMQRQKIEAEAEAPKPKPEEGE